MEKLKQIGELCKQHYEKLILSLALAALAFAAWVFYQKGEATKELIATWVEPPKARPKGLAPVNLTTNQAVLSLVSNRPALNLSRPHNLLNPVKWQKRTDGSIIKIATGDEVGAAQIEVTGLTPLLYKIALNRFSPGADGQPAVFTFSTSDESVTFSKRIPLKRAFYLNTTDNRKNDSASLVAVRGAPDDPEVVLEMADTQKQVTVTKDKPHEEVRAYLADLKYKIDGRSFPNLKEEQVLEIGGDKYKIIAIKQNEVVLSGLLNNKNYSIPYSAP